MNSQLPNSNPPRRQTLLSDSLLLDSLVSESLTVLLDSPFSPVRSPAVNFPDGHRRKLTLTVLARIRLHVSSE